MESVITKYLIPDEVVCDRFIGLTVLTGKRAPAMCGGYVGYVTNKRVIFLSERSGRTRMEEIAHKHIASAQLEMTGRKTVIVWLSIIIALPLLLVGEIAYNWAALFVLFIGVLAYLMAKPSESLRLRGAGTDLLIKADEETLDQMLMSIRKNGGL